MILQLLHFHAVFKTWPTFQELASIVSFRRRRWSQRNFSKIETYRVIKVKICLVKYEDYEETLFLPPDVGVAALVICLRFLNENVDTSPFRLHFLFSFLLNSFNCFSNVTYLNSKFYDFSRFKNLILKFKIKLSVNTSWAAQHVFFKQTFSSVLQPY